jgi:hypothetical protein
MTREEFIASARPVSDEIWQVMGEEGVQPEGGRETVTEYGGEYVLHVQDGQYFPHAWWYAPAPKATLQEAEETLWQWRQEWV